MNFNFKAFWTCFLNAHSCWQPLKGGNLDCTSRVICACWYQILRFFNFGGHFYYSNFSSWSNESALRFFDFALFHGQNQVLSLFVTFRHFFNNNLDCTSRALQRVHETLQKWDFTIFSNFHDLHETLKKLDASIFSNFHDPGYTKPCKNQTLQFSPIFFSWPRVHETLQKSDFTIFSNLHDPAYMKPWKNRMLQFSLIFMTPGTRNLAKIRLYNFF